MGRSLLILYLSLFCCCEVPIDPAERAFRISLRQLEQRTSPSKRALRRLFDDFDVVQGPDYVRVRALEQRGERADWPERYALYKAMQERLLAVYPYFPIGAADDYRGGYGLSDLDSLRETARLGAGEYYLDLAESAIVAARTGNKYAAREAYGYLYRAFDYLPERKARYSAILSEMAERGTVRVLLTIVGEPVLQALARESAYRSGAVVDDWFIIEVHDTGQAVDYGAKLQLTHYQADGPHESSSETQYTEEVLDYVEKREYKERINDSTVVTKVKEIEHFRTVTATVTEVRQDFEVDAYGSLSIFDTRTGRQTVPARYVGTASWENEYSTCRGDREALPAFACSGIRRWPPGRNEMLRQAVDDLLRITRWKLKRSYAP